MNKKLVILNRIHKEKIMAIVRVETVERAVEIVEGCKAGGITCLEISYTNNNAGEIIKQLKEIYQDEIVEPYWIAKPLGMRFYMVLNSSSHRLFQKQSHR